MSSRRRRAWLTSTVLSGVGRLSIPLAASLATSVAGGLPAHANPVGGQVVRGQASISHAGDTVTVDQSSRKAVIDWRRFDIAPGERTVFNQPGADAIVLNRVTGHDPSRIHGAIQAVGHVWLVNPNGVAFGPNAVVDVNGLLATTADIANDAFMAGRFDFATPSPVAGASVVNQGRISVGEKGLAALVAPRVRNDGAIVGQYAQVVLAGAETFAIDFAGDGLLNFAAGQPVSPSGDQPLVANAGRIDAPGGAVLLSAHAADAVVDNVITMDGVIEARTAHLSGSTVVLSGGDHGGVAITGRIDASGLETGRTGGRVEITGETVVLDGGALVDASGAAGGGTVLVGGDFEGGGTLARATTTLVDDATIRADATRAGDGGRVILWSDDHTGFAGLISARGGPGGGDGGFAEVSGKQTLSYRGFTDLRAPAGATGDLLLDPGDIIIDDAGSDPIPGGPVGGSDPDVTIASATIEAQLVGANVTLQAANDILVQSDVDTTGLTAPTGSLTLDAGNAISVDAAIALQNQTLTLDADNGITVNAAITTGGAAALNANADATGGGTLAINQAVGAGGALTLSGADATIAAGLTLTGAGVTLTGATTAAGALTIDATGGTATINSALTATAGGADVIIRADDLALNAALNNGTNTTTIERPAAGDLRIGGGAAAGLTLDTTELGRIGTGRLVFGNATVGTIFVGGLSTTIPTVELVATTDIDVDATSSFQALVVRRADAGNILLGGSGGFSLPTADLVPLSITDLTVVTTDGSIIAQTLTIMRPVTLDASANGGQVSFTGSTQTFGSLDVVAGTVQVGTNLNTVTGDLIIESSAGTTITAGPLTSAGTLVFEGAGVVSSGALTLSSTGIMQFDAVLSTGGAALDIIAADLAINGGGGLNAGAGRVTITPGSGGVGLGGGAGALRLADAEIDRITAGVLDINTAGGGGIAVDGVSTGLTLELTAAAGTSFSGAASSFSGLDLTGAGNTSFAVDVSANGDLVLGSSVTASANVTLAADADDNGVGDLTVPAGGTLNAGGNALTLQAADVGLGAGASVTAGSVTLSATNGRDVALNTAGGAFDADLGQFTTASVTATTGGAGAITLGAVSDAGLDLDVQAGGSISLTGDVTVNSFAATAPSGIALAAGLTVSAADGIALNDDAVAAGGLTLSADTDADGGTLTLGGGLTATGGDVTITASGLTLTGPIDNGTNTLTIRPSQAGLTMGLGGAGTLALSAAEVGNITAGTLVFGDATAGTLTVGALATAQTDQIGTVRPITGADIVFGGNATFQTLDAQAETGIAVTGDLTTVAGDLALLSDVSGLGGGNLTLGNATLTARADGTTVDLDAGSGTLSGGTVSLRAGGDLRLGQSLTVTGGLTLVADFEPSGNGNGTGSVIVDPGVTIAAGAGPVAITAADLTIDATASVTAGSVSLVASNDRSLALNATGSEFDADLGRFTTSSVTATTTGTGSITLGTVSEAGLDLDVQAANTVTVNGDITAASFTATAPAGIALAAGVTVAAADGIALNDDAVAAGGLTLSADTDADGGTLTLGGGLTATGGDVTITASGLTLTGPIDNGTNTLTIRPSQAGLTMGLGGAGTLALSAADLDGITAGTLVFGGTGAGTLTVGALATAQTDQIGTVRLITGADITLGGDATFQSLDAQAETGMAVTGDLTTLAGDLTLVSDASGVGGGDLSLGNVILTAQADGTTVGLDAGSGTLSGGAVTLRAGGDLALSQSLTVTGGLTLVADFEVAGNGNGTGTLTLGPGVTVAAGANPITITAADLVVDPTATLSAGSITLQASDDRSVGLNGTGVGFDLSAAEAARLTSASLSVVTTGAGGISAVGLNEAGRTVSLQAGGAIDLSGATVAGTLQATAGGMLTVGGTVDTTLGDLTLSSGSGLAIAPSALTSAGALTLSGTGDFTADGLTLTANSGVTLDASGTVATSLGVIADADSVGGGAFVVTAGSTVAVDGPVDISATAITIDGTLTSTGRLGLTVPDGLPLGLGAVTGGLDLTNADLLNLVAQTLGLSTSGAGGDVVVAGLDIDGAGGIDQLTIDASGTVAFTTAPSDVNALVVTAAGGITVDQDVTAAVGDLRLASQAGIATAAGVTLDAGGALVLSPTGSAVSAAGALTLRAGAGITLDTGLTGAGALTVDADTDDDGTGLLTAGGTVQTSAGAIALRAADAALTGGLVSPVGLTLTASAGTDLAFGAATTSTLVVDGTELAGISAPLVTLVTEGGGDITLNGLTLANTAGIGDLVAQAGGSLRIGTADVAFDGDLDGTALTGVVIDGDVTVSDGDLALVAVGGDLSAATGVVATAGGGVTRLGAQAGAMALGDGVTLGGTGTLLLTAGTGISGAGGLTLNAADGFELTAPLTAGGAVTINADADGDGSGALTLTGALAAGGDIDLLGSVIDVGATIDNAGATLRLRSAMAGASLGLAGAAGDFTVGGDALGRITTGTLVLGDAAGGAIAVGALDAGMMSGIGGLELVGAGGATFDGPLDGGFDLAIDVGGDVTFARDVGRRQRLGDVTFRNAGDVAIDGFFIAGALEITVAGDFTNTNQTRQADVSLGLDVASLLILNANSFQGFGAVAGITGQQAAVVADARPRSNSYVLNGCIIGSLTNCFNFGVDLPSTTLRFDFDKSRLFVAVQGDRELDEDSLFSNVGNEELW